MTDRLFVGEHLTPGEANQLWNSIHDTRFILQDDGNMVLYTGQVEWASNTVGKGGIDLTLQADGNLVLYDGSDHPVWSTGTTGSGAIVLVLQDDGNLVLYDAKGAPKWATNTVKNNGFASDALKIGEIIGDGVLIAGAAFGLPTATYIPQFNAAMSGLTSLVGTNAHITLGGLLNAAVQNSGSLSISLPDVPSLPGLSASVVGQAEAAASAGSPEQAFAVVAQGSGILPSSLASDPSSPLYAQAWALSTQGGTLMTQLKPPVNTPYTLRAIAARTPTPTPPVPPPPLVLSRVTAVSSGGGPSGPTDADVTAESVRLMQDPTFRPDLKLGGGVRAAAAGQQARLTVAARRAAALPAPGAPAGAYAPYPQRVGTVGAPPPHGGGHGGGGHGGGHGGHGSSRPGHDFFRRGGAWWTPPSEEIVETCASWGSPAPMTPDLDMIGKRVLAQSGGAPTQVVHDGVIYRFSYEDGLIHARPCALQSTAYAATLSAGVGDAAPSLPLFYVYMRFPWIDQWTPVGDGWVPGPTADQYVTKLLASDALVQFAAYKWDGFRMVWQPTI